MQWLSRLDAEDEQVGMELRARHASDTGRTCSCGHLPVKQRIKAIGLGSSITSDGFSGFGTFLVRVRQNSFQRMTSLCYQKRGTWSDRERDCVTIIVAPWRNCFSLSVPGAGLR